MLPNSLEDESKYSIYKFDEILRTEHEWNRKELSDDKIIKYIQKNIEKINWMNTEHFEIILGGSLLKILGFKNSLLTLKCISW